MKVLLDSGVWWRFKRGAALHPRLLSLLGKEDLEPYLSPLSVMEIEYKIAQGRLEEPKAPDWRAASLEGLELAPLTVEAARLAAGWTWEHRDPFDRLLAGVAQAGGLTLIHTDTVLKGLEGFPQEYFPGATGTG
jgi:PIN domain nuclease of toxin-antitoxin system